MSYPQCSSTLWTAYEAAAATGGQLLLGGHGRHEDARAGADNWVACGISFDTRSLAPGDLFVALQGARDGHDFLGTAASKGASAALVSRIPDNAPPGLPLLKVADPLKALEQLGIAARQRNFGKLIAVTGSVGKTTTKEMLRAALSVAGRVHAAQKSFNNHLGVPTSLASLPQSADFGVFEIGMNHAGEITPLVGLVKPHVAIVTAIAPAHLEHFNSVEDIARAKAEILSGVRAGGTAVLPADSEFYPLLREMAEEQGITRLIPFGESDIAAMGGQLLDYRPEGEGAEVKARLLGTEVTFRLGAAGRHLAMNALAVIVAATSAGAPLEVVLKGLEEFRAGEGRGARHEVNLDGGTVLLLDEAYNANPASMAAALEVLGGVSPEGEGRRVAVLGAMKELGPAGAALHAGLAGPLERAGVAKVLLSGEEMQALKEALPAETLAGYAPTGEGLVEALEEILRPGDVVLFKGSNASGIGAVLREFLAKHARPE